MRSLAYISLVLACLACQRTADAAIVFGYSVGLDPVPTAWDGSEVIVDVNDLTTINVFLIETPGDTRLTDEGVNNFEFRMEYNKDVGFLDNPKNEPPPPFGAGSDVDPQWDLPFLVSDTSGNPAVLEMGGSGVLFMGGIFPIRPLPGTNFVRLGEFRYQANIEGTTTFTMNDRQPDPARQNNLLGNDAVIDDELFPANQGGVNPIFRITAVTAIPEPSSVVALAGAAVIGLRVRRRRRVK